MRKLALAAISFSTAIFTANFFLTEYEPEAFAAAAIAGLILSPIGRRRVKAMGIVLLFFAVLPLLSVTVVSIVTVPDVARTPDVKELPE